MADIELVIKIPKEIRLALINNIQLSMDQQSICDSYIKQAIINGTPLDTIKTEIADIYCGQYCENPPTADAVREMVLDILDNIGKAESEDT